MTHRWLIGTGGVLALAAALALIAAWGGASLAEDGIIYVDADATGSNSGADWTNAYTDLQDALAEAEAVAPVQIWVAEGTYKPTSGTDRTISFQMVNGVAIYGGFAGTETELGQRNWVLHETILSGDIGIFPDNSDNSYHVFYHPAGLALDGTAILDGFNIVEGNADGTDPHNRGGGMVNVSSSPTLTNCTFSGDSAGYGGAMFNEVSSPTLTNCTFEDNSAGYGGGMVNSSSSPALTNCTFSGNSAGVGGGAMYNGGSSPTLTNCTFTGNSASGILATGGGMHNYGSSPTLTNCTFSGNSADVSGAAMYNNYYSSPALTNCILWGDVPGEIHNLDEGSSPVVTYSDVQGGCVGEGNINEDPLFVAAASGNLRLQLGSPCIDAGNNGAVPAAVTTDLDGNPRFSDFLSVPDTGSGHLPIVDMGAYEAHPEVIYVDHDATGADDGTSWDDAYPDLQDALDAAVAPAPAQIWVAAGTYKPNPGDDRTASFMMANRVEICGGFDPSAGATEWGHRDSVLHETILSGDIGEATIADNSYHVLQAIEITEFAVLDGFTITGGNANGLAAPDDRGGGMYNKGSSPILTNLTFTGNSATYGGGIYNDDSSPVLGDCTFFNNTAADDDGDGGGMSNANNSDPVLTNCTFIGNTATRWGGAMSNGESNPTLTNVTMSGNSAGEYGDGIFNWASSPLLTNCILWEGDTPEEIHNTDGSSTPAVTYSDIQGGYSGEGNKDEDPLFADPDNGDVHLRPGSPCIDAGKNSAPYLPAYDFEGHPRIMDGDRDGIPTVDMGVDEVFGYRVHLPVVLRGD